MPRSLIELASSSSCALEKSRRGLRGLGRRNSIGTRRWLRTRSEAAALLVSAPISPIRDARPRPRRDRVDSSAMADSPEKSFTSSVSSLQIAATLPPLALTQATAGPPLTSPRLRGEVERAKRARLRGLSASLSFADRHLLIRESTPVARPPHPDPLPPLGGEGAERRRTDPLC